MMTMKSMQKSVHLILIVFFLFTYSISNGTVYQVTTTTFTGLGSISQAVANANANPGKDTIYFSIPGTGPHTIIMASDFNITQAILIDGTSQTGYNPLAPKPVIEFRNSPAMAFNISGGSSDIRALAINNCGAMGIYYITSNNKITGCYIGINLDGITDNGNGAAGLSFNNSSGNIIGGATVAERNIISGNNNHGIQFSTCSNNYIIGNYIGTTSTGLGICGNALEGINFNSLSNSVSNNNKIGGLTIDSANVIGGNGLHGIELVTNCSNNFIVGNYIGLAVNLTTNIENLTHGVLLLNNSNSNKVYSNFICNNNGIGIVINNSNNNFIGNTGRRYRNVISGQGSHGIDMSNSSSTIIKSNFIGIGVNGLTAMGNGSLGINVYRCPGTIIGGVHSTEGNIISSNSIHGIEIGDGPIFSKKCIVKGNYIGTDSTGKGNFGNSVIGLVIKSDSCTIGSVIAEEANIIGGSGLAGLLIANSNGNNVQGNLIGLGSDLSPIPNDGDGLIIAIENAGNTSSNNIVNYNTIAYNTGNGINVGKSLNGHINSNERNNDLRFNSIYCNVQLGISLNLTNAADQGNNGKIAPIINNALSTSTKVVGLANGLLPTDAIDIYEMTDCINCDQNPQGKIFVATVFPDASGNWSYDQGSPITGTLIATATDALRNTSQFSLCFTPCKAVAKVNPSEVSVQLEMNKTIPVTLVSSSVFSTLTTEPGKQFWSIGIPDTTGPYLISKATNVTVDFMLGGAFGPGVYNIFLIAQQSGCKDTTQVKINVFFIPNIITPNGDQLNDQWVVGNGPGQFDAKIYNRWGDLVYSKSDYSNEWDGSGLGDGVYYYSLDDKTDSKKSYKGWVQIIK